jgi:hypothetical protein
MCRIVWDSTGCACVILKGRLRQNIEALLRLMQTHTERPDRISLAPIQCNLTSS